MEESYERRPTPIRGEIEWKGVIGQRKKKRNTQKNSSGR